MRHINAPPQPSEPLLPARERHRAWSHRLRLYGAIGIGVMAVQIVAYLGLSLQRHIPIGRDAWSYVAATRALAAGANPYTQPLAALLPDAPDVPSPYLYPPLLAFLLTPLASQPLPIALAIWLLAVAISHALLIAALKPFLGWRCAAVAVLAWMPTWEGAYYGQINAWVAVCLAMGLLALRERHEGRVALWFVLGALLKITPGIALLTFLIRAGWRTRLIALLAGLLLIGITLPQAPLHLWLDGSVAAFTVRRDNAWYTSWGAAAAHLPGALGGYGPLVVAAAATLLTLVRGRQLPLPLALAAAIFVPILVARTAWPHHAVMALPALAVLWTWSRRGRWVAAVAWVVVGLIGFGTAPLALTACWIVCLWPGLIADPPASDQLSFAGARAPSTSGSQGA